MLRNCSPSQCKRDAHEKQFAGPIAVHHGRLMKSQPPQGTSTAWPGVPDIPSLKMAMLVITIPWPDMQTSSGKTWTSFLVNLPTLSPPLARSMPDPGSYPVLGFLVEGLGNAKGMESTVSGLGFLRDGGKENGNFG